MDTPAEIQQATIDAAALQQVEARLQRLEQAPAPILPSEESLAQWAIAAQRVGLSHAELAALVEQTTSSCEATAAAAQQRLDGLDAQQAALASTISDSLSQAQESTAAAVVNMEQQGAAALSDIEQQAVAEARKAAIPVAREVAALEAAKHWGSSVTIAAELPTETDPSSWAMRWYGRDFLIPGDGALVETPNILRTFRYTGRGWVEGGTIEPKVVREDVKASVLNTGNAVYPVMASAAAGGSGGSGLADPLTVSIVTKGASVAVADSSRWQAGGYDTFTSGVIHLEFIPNQGIMGGKHHFVTAAFVLLAGTPDTFKVTEFSVLGAGFEGGSNVFDVSFDGAIGAATAPGGLGIALPAGTKPAARIFVTITAADPATRDFTIKGNIIWVPESSTGTQLPNLPVRKQPAWLLVS
jgi:hypothetical protein